MDTAIDALKPMGFLPDVIRKKVKELLEVYGGREGWAFIEEASYKLLIDSILEDKENEKCGLGEPNLLQDRKREKPWEPLFEISICSYFLTFSFVCADTSNRRQSIW
uniref:WIYLD domain-containing protein n=1 Tax=Opuntia streptacantha TaxID=393608 RepID=A0A7C9E7G1_OPUST